MKTSPLLALSLASLCTLALGCNNKKPSETKSGPAVAHVGQDVITADEFKKKLDETSPFLRARYNTLDRKKEFLENLIRNELLVQEAEKRGLENAPAVREQMKRALVTELLRQQLDERLTGADIPDADLQKFYDTHQDDFVKPERARINRILVEAPKGDAKARSAAKKDSDDKLSKSMGGDLRFLSKDEMAKTYSPELAEAAFALKTPNEQAGPIETTQGYELIKLQVKTVALDRKFDEAKEQIRGRMARERRSHEYDDFIKKLREQANVTIDDAELAKIVAAEAPAGAPPNGMMMQPGMQPGQQFPMARPPQPGQPPRPPNAIQPAPAPILPAPK
jgi:peptidyl-prolyl cis-trans isomerase C